ncbi:hypothetical protein GGF43_002237 [Coemansia sp. RSA 2618]|nr:hypothetical protein GGF43_002237 [Coemansia sp. RSA 2618]
MTDSDSEHAPIPARAAAPQAQRASTNAPGGPLSPTQWSTLPPIQGRRESQPVVAHRETPPMQGRRESQPVAAQRAIPPLPGRHMSQPALPHGEMLSPTQRIEALSQKKMPTMPAFTEHIATPPPVAQYEPGTGYPTGGAYDAGMGYPTHGTYDAGAGYPTDGAYEVPDDVATEHAKFQLDTQATPAPTHRGGFHRSVNSLPTNVPVISAPPGSDVLLAAPSAPPMTERRPTFLSMGHYHEASDSGSGGDADGEPEFLSRQATPSEDVRSAALHDARANMGRAMFSDRVMNFRDVGVSVMRAGLSMNQSREQAGRIGPMPGVVFRSAEVGSAGEHDVKTLFSKYGIRTIIDLRSELEARASDILTTHYPASMQPTSDESDEKLARLRAAQLRNTIVEVAAHDYETAARPWERTGETHASWSRRNSLRYSRSIGDPRRDPLARALAHLYDHDSDSDTQNVTTTEPYVPREPASEPESLHTTKCEQPTPESGAESATPQHPGLAQSAYDWGNETLQMLRSYWDYQWPGERKSEPPAAPLPPLPSPGNDHASGNGHASVNDHASAIARTATDESSSKDDAASVNGGSSFNDSASTDSFYINRSSDRNREPMRYGLRPIDYDNPKVSGDAPQIVVGSNDKQTEQDTDREPDRAADRVSQIRLSRVTTEPSLTRLAQHHAHQRNQLSVPSVENLRKPRIVNRFGGARTRFRCNVIGENYRKKCVWAHAPLSTKIKVVLRFATFNKAEAIRTIGREVLAPRGLAGSYEDYVDYCKEEFAAVLRIFADPCAYPILFHCQHGKDRTGIIAMLLLGILGVDDHIIAEDYALSEKCLAPVRQRMEMLDMGAVGLPPSFCESPAPAMLNLLRHIKANYGSVRGYLRSAGLSSQEINTIAWCLRGNFCGIAPPHARSSRSPGPPQNISTM